MDDTKDDQETDLAETPEQGNQSSGAFPPPIANIKVLFPFKASDIYETSVVNKKANSVSLLNRVLLAQIDKQAEDWNGLQFIVVFENMLA